jgi:hypothetical protein
MWPGEVTTSIERKWLAHWLVLFSDNNNNYSRRRIWFPSLLSRSCKKEREKPWIGLFLSFPLVFFLSLHTPAGATLFFLVYTFIHFFFFTPTFVFFFYLKKKKKKNPYISNIPLWTFGRGIIRRRGNSSNVFKRLKGPWANLIFFDENLLLIGQCSPFPFFKAFFVFRATGKTGEETPTSCGNDIPPHLQGKTTSLNFQRISSP